MLDDFSSLTPLDGGWSGQTFLGETAGERTVVRIYPPAQSGHSPEIDAALLRLVRGLLPVADVLEARTPAPARDEPGLLVTTFLPGERGDLLIPTLNREQMRRLGGELGRLLNRLSGMPMLKTGPFIDETLSIGSFGDLDGLPAFVESHRSALSWWTQDELAGLAEITVDAQALLDQVTRSCLVHSDFNSKNLLIDPQTLQVTGLLDWEFAHAGHPFTDLGNLIRWERDPAFVEATIEAFDAKGHPNPVDLARAADLWALIDLATRRGANPVATEADVLLRGIARERDVHAGWTSRLR